MKEDVICELCGENDNDDLIYYYDCGKFHHNCFLKRIEEIKQETEKAEQETSEALEIVRLLEEMRKSQCCIYSTHDMWIVEFMDVINEKYDIISMEKDLLQCLKIAANEGWKP